MAVRFGEGRPQLLALAHHGGPAGHPWQVLAFTQLPADTGPETVVQLPGTVEVKALAVDRHGKVHVLVEDRALQVCTIQVYGRQGGAPPAWVPDTAVPWACFGPGAAAGDRLGFPEIRAMATDSKANVFLTDAANGVVWMMRAGDRQLRIVAGRPGTILVRALGDLAAKALDTSLYLPTGLAVTAEDDLLLTSGDALFRLNAPGTADTPWTPVVSRVAMKTQPLHNRGAGAPPPEEPSAGGAAPRTLDLNGIRRGGFNLAREAQGRGETEKAAKLYLAYLAANADGDDAGAAKAALVLLLPDAGRLAEDHARAALAAAAIAEAEATAAENAAALAKAQGRHVAANTDKGKAGRAKTTALAKAREAREQFQVARTCYGAFLRLADAGHGNRAAVEGRLAGLP